jgi:hypothetical protein
MLDKYSVIGICFACENDKAIFFDLVMAKSPCTAKRKFTSAYPLGEDFMLAVKMKNPGSLQGSRLKKDPLLNFNLAQIY